MSKTALKKELSTLSHDQLLQIVLDAYDANTDFKEYFEFFLNPNVEKLLEGHDKVIVKELGRVKWGYSKARTSIIKKAVKKFMGFNPGPEAVLDMLFLTLKRLGVNERFLNFSKPQFNYVILLVRQIIRFAEASRLVSDAMNRLAEELESSQYTTYFKQHIRDAISAEQTR